MDTSPVSRILEDWNAVANKARRPSVAPHRVVVRTGLPGGTLVGAGFLVVALLAAGIWLGRPGMNGPGGFSPAPTATPTSTPTSAGTTPNCDPTAVEAVITIWEGAAGHRIADVELANIGPVSCLVDTLMRPQLVDGDGSVLINGASPSPSTLILLDPGDVLSTLVQAGNYCGPDPAPPVSVAFIYGDGDSIVATPLTPTDVTLPPCLGASGSAGTIEMQPWAP